MDVTSTEATVPARYEAYDGMSASSLVFFASTLEVDGAVAVRAIRIINNAAESRQEPRVCSYGQCGEEIEIVPQ